MEIDVTHMVEDADYMPFLCGGVAELGNRAATLTWENSQRYAVRSPLLKPDQLEKARKYFADMGFGDDARGWSDAETQAAMVQEVAATIREMERYASYERFSEQNGRLYCATAGKSSEARWFYFVGR